VENKMSRKMKDRIEIAMFIAAIILIMYVPFPGDLI